MINWFAALAATFGDVNAAVERLLASRQPGSLSWVPRYIRCTPSIKRKQINVLHISAGIFFKAYFTSSKKCTNVILFRLTRFLLLLPGYFKVKKVARWFVSCKHIAVPGLGILYFGGVGGGLSHFFPWTGPGYGLPRKRLRHDLSANVDRTGHGLSYYEAGSLYALECCVLPVGNNNSSLE